MTEKNYYTLSNYYDHTTFGGALPDFAFDEHATIATIAGRIMSDWNFDKRCKKNARWRDMSKRKNFMEDENNE